MNTVAPKVLRFLPDLSRNTFSNKCLSKIALNAELKNSYHMEIYACADQSRSIIESIIESKLQSIRDSIIESNL